MYRKILVPLDGSVLVDAVFPNADSIAVSTHRRSGLARLVHGSVTDKVLQSATCPVLLIRTNGGG
jgi:nucleotide-binding universal stress UspA family protein